MKNTRLDVVGPNDDFHLALRRQGWHLTGYKPVYADPQVIAPQPQTQWNDVWSKAPSFYEVFSDNTARKLIRAVMYAPRTREDLLRICGDVSKLDATLQFLEWGRIFAQYGDTWTKGPACTGVDNTGPTLEWYVAEWFRHELQAPARHGVTLQEVPRGGDLDVVAFVNDVRVFVECKTGKPESISETDIRWFLQRAHEFNPEIAVLLIDTESEITEPVRLVAEIMSEMNWLESHPNEIDPPDNARQIVRPTDVPYGYDALYPCARSVFLTGVPSSIDTALSAVLRLYHSHIRHQLILPVPLEWDFVARRVRGTPGDPFGIEGQLRA